MAQPHGDTLFAGGIPQAYADYLVPLIFEPYAADLAARLAAHGPRDVLEIAAGTGVVTRYLARVLPPGTRITATDLNPPMLEQARAAGTDRPVEWMQADAMALPFPDASFDAVVCQFGVMFFPDRARAFAEARRVLRQGGVFLFNTWDRLEHNEVPDVVTHALAALFPEDPPRFLARVVHGYADREVVLRDLREGGFAEPAAIEVVTQRSRAPSPLAPAIAFCQGTPLRNEIEGRRSDALGEATVWAERELAARFGTGAVDGKIQAFVCSVRR